MKPRECKHLCYKLFIVCIDFSYPRYYFDLNVINKIAHIKMSWEHIEIKKQPNTHTAYTYTDTHNRLLSEKSMASENYASINQHVFKIIFNHIETWSGCENVISIVFMINHTSREKKATKLLNKHQQKLKEVNTNDIIKNVKNSESINDTYAWRYSSCSKL